LCTHLKIHKTKSIIIIFENKFPIMGNQCASCSGAPEEGEVLVKV
jgi:hypothetical protein